MAEILIVRILFQRDRAMRIVVELATAVLLLDPFLDLLLSLAHPILSSVSTIRDHICGGTYI